MGIAEKLGAPEWVTSTAVVGGGLDLMGLRLPVQRIGGSLLNGITTVTPAIRYVAFRAWLIQHYRSHGLMDRVDDFTKYAADVECAIVLGNLLQDRSITLMIGTDEALKRIDESGERIEISALVVSPAATIYTGPSMQLNVSGYLEDSEVPVLSASRGLPMASAVDGSLGRYRAFKGLLAGKPPNDLARDELAELGEAVRIDRIPELERECLVHALVPTTPLQSERSRIGTYAALLLLSKQNGRMPTERDLFRAACSSRSFGDPLLDSLADGWLTYCLRDLIAVTEEAVLSAVVNEITLWPDDGRGGVLGSEVIASLMDRLPEHDAVMRDLKLVNGGESMADLSIRSLFDRVEKRIGRNRAERGGVVRWEGDFVEPALYQAALGSGAGALSVAVVGRMLAALRVGTGVREGRPELELLSYQGRRRLGMAQSVIPEMDKWLKENPPVRQVAAQLAYRSVQQHLQIAWSRMQVDFQRDVALLTTEGDRWFSRQKAFSAGRTASRLQQAIGWLHQLKLIDQKGITADGEDVLRHALSIVESEVEA
jgi:hypothetical protein